MSADENSPPVPEGVMQAVRDGFSAPEEVARYRERAGRGLLVWEVAVERRYLRPPGRVLDIGCGGGREAFALAALGHEVVGVDISPAQVASARATASALGREISFQVCDGVSLGFADGAFDYVVVWAQVLGNVPGWEGRGRFLRECVRVLKPSGALSFSVHNREVCEPVARERSLVLSQGPEEGDFTLREEAVEGLTRYWHYFDRDEIVELCEDAGLRVRECCLAPELGQVGWETIWVAVCVRG